MENSGIVLRKAVLHVLDNGYRGLILSDHPLDLVGEQFDFLRNILLKVHKSDSTMHGQFNQDASYVYQRLLELDENIWKVLWKQVKKLQRHYLML